MYPVITVITIGTVAKLSNLLVFQGRNFATAHRPRLRTAREDFPAVVVGVSFEQGGPHPLWRWRGRRGRDDGGAEVEGAARGRQEAGGDALLRRVTRDPEQMEARR